MNLPLHSDIAWHTVSPEDVIRELTVDVALGLDPEEIQRRHVRYGNNVLEEAPPVPLWKRLLRQFHNLVIWILIFAAVISGVMAEWADALSILAMVLLKGILGFVQEERAERALAALQKLSSPMAKVRRDGSVQLLPASELVPGDCIELEAGDNIPADARQLTAFGFQTQEAALTGESLPNDKDAACLLSADAPLGDRRNMVYMGTVTSAGPATAVVVATGMHTELKRIAGPAPAGRTGTDATATPHGGTGESAGCCLSGDRGGYLPVATVARWPPAGDVVDLGQLGRGGCARRTARRDYADASAGAAADGQAECGGCR